MDQSIGQLELDIAQAEFAKAKADLAIAQATVSKCTIVAPFSGLVVEQKAREFQYAAPGQPNTLMVSRLMHLAQIFSADAPARSSSRFENFEN